ncbi:alpha-parvin-like protein [Cricetulus griseus]|nr:alpha-parvin-like protein [Cricetulus griseus]
MATSPQKSPSVPKSPTPKSPPSRKKDDSFLGKLGGTLARRKKAKEGCLDSHPWLWVTSWRAGNKRKPFVTYPIPKGARKLGTRTKIHGFDKHGCLGYLNKYALD